ncbi:hypothetical protein F4604DRAFT_1676930 [Suillus subluteus]|nr:hypothetical protein F4604DRAFT_1676930 [Suillus subluteus]
MPCGQNDVMHAKKLTGVYTSTAVMLLTHFLVAGIVLTIVAVITTSFRLSVRARQKRLWIDDAWAALGMIFNFILVIVDCLYLQDYERYPQGARVALYYMVAQFFYAVVWSSRISILFTIVRLTIPKTVFRRVLMFAAIVFGTIWALLFSQLWWICETEAGWKLQPHPQCDLGRTVAITQMITDVLADFFLILAPFFFLYKVRLSRAQKVRILSVFSTSAITTIVSLTHAYFIFSGGGTKEVMAAMIEASMSLIVANLSVVVAFIFNLKAEEESPSLPTPIVTFGSQPRKRVRDPLATTFIGVESTPIVLEDLSGSGPRSLKTGDDDEISFNNMEGKQTIE